MRWWFPLVIAACAADKPCAEGTVADADGRCQYISSDSAEPTGNEDDTSTDPADTAEPAPPVHYEALAPSRLLRRMSLDLNGVLPSVSDLDAVEADPEALDLWIDEALADPRLEDRLIALFGEIWHTQVDEFQVEYLLFSDFVQGEENEFAFERAVGEEPLRLLAHIGVNDRPWTEVVTADYTMANEILGLIWPLDYPDDQTGWRESRYTDERPAAGVLTTSGLWMRYYSTATNYNRTRAAALTRLLICEDYLVRPVSFASIPSLFDPDSTAPALKEDPYCLGCHSTLDPIAASLFGFWSRDLLLGAELGWYHTEREPMGPTLMGVNLQWFGQPVSDLGELAQHIAADSRFRRCAVETMAQSLWRRTPDTTDLSVLQDLDGEFVNGDLRLKSLIRAILDTEIYRAGGFTEEPTDAVATDENTARLLMPDQWASLVEDLTGVTWSWSGFDQLTNDTYGYRVMAGGVNGLHVTQPQIVPTLTHALTIQRLSEVAATTIVDHDIADTPDTPMVLSDVGLDHGTDDPEFTAAIDALFWRFIGRRPTAEDRESLVTLWSDIDEDLGPRAAWIGVVSAVFRHPEFIHT